MKITRLIILPALLAVLILAAGCVPETAAPDLNEIKTQAAATVAAQSTLDAVLAQPTETSAPEETLPPAWTATSPAVAVAVAAADTSTPEPTPTTKVVSSGGSTSSGSTSSGSSSSSSSSSDEKKSTAYACRLVSQSPVDGQVMKPLEPFDGRWTLKNTGTATWTTDEFQFFLRQGEKFEAADGSFISEEVEPGDSYTFVVDMIAPFNPGFYVSEWWMRSDNNEYFCKFYVAIKVQ